VAPELKQEVEEIAGLYIGFRYGHETKDPLLKQLRRRVRQFRPGRITGDEEVKSDSGGFGAQF